MNFELKDTHISVTSLDQNVSAMLQIISMLGMLEKFGTESYTWRFNIVQKSLSIATIFLV